MNDQNVYPGKVYFIIITVYGFLINELHMGLMDAERETFLAELDFVLSLNLTNSTSCIQSTLYVHCVFGELLTVRVTLIFSI